MSLMKLETAKSGVVIVNYLISICYCNMLDSLRIDCLADAPL